MDTIINTLPTFPITATEIANCDELAEQTTDDTPTSVLVEYTEHEEVITETCLVDVNNADAQQIYMARTKLQSSRYASMDVTTVVNESMSSLVRATSVTPKIPIEDCYMRDTRKTSTSSPFDQCEPHMPSDEYTENDEITFSGVERTSTICSQGNSIYKYYR